MANDASHGNAAPLLPPDLLRRARLPNAAVPEPAPEPPKAATTISYRPLILEKLAQQSAAQSQSPLPHVPLPAFALGNPIYEPAPATAPPGEPLLRSMPYNLRHKAKSKRRDQSQAFAADPRVYVFCGIGEYCDNPTQMAVLSQVIYWFLSPAPRVDRKGNMRHVVSEYNAFDESYHPKINGPTLVKLSHRNIRRKRGTIQEYLDPKYLETIKRRAEQRINIAAEDEPEDWRWAVTLPYTRWATDTGLTVRQVRTALQAMAGRGWFELRHNSKRQPIVIEGEQMRTEEFREQWLDSQARLDLRGTMLTVRNLQMCKDNILATLLLSRIIRLTYYWKTPEIYRTSQELAYDFSVSVGQIDRAKAHLVKLGLLIVDKAKWVGSAESRHKASFMQPNMVVIRDRQERIDIQRKSKMRKAVKTNKIHETQSRDKIAG